VYHCPASGGDAVALSQDVDGGSPQESLDGKTLYFASVAAKTVLKRLTLPAQPGTESEVEGLPRLRSSELWAVPGRNEDGLFPTLLFSSVFISAADHYVIFDPK
jgi:hypothetical protein